MKVMTILLYVSGLSMNAIAQLFHVSAQAVLTVFYAIMGYKP
jgi:predicted DNA-binding protein YlxM (UPF0122 family)